MMRTTRLSLVSLAVFLLSFQAYAVTTLRVEVVRNSAKVARGIFGAAFTVEAADRSLLKITCTQQYFPTTTTLSFMLQKTEEGGVEDSRIKLNQVVNNFDQCKATLSAAFDRFKAGADSITVQKSADTMVFSSEN